MKRLNKIIPILLFAMVWGGLTKAQLNPNGAQYYVNQYIANPAMAGTTEGFSINGVYRALWNNIPGAPVSQNVTGEYGFERVGLGINLSNESAGLLRQTRLVATYAYRIKVDNAGSQISFGLSGGFMSQRLDQTNLQGNAGDPMIGYYNARKTYIDGDFGAAYIGSNLTILATVPNLKSFFKKDVVKLADESTFYSAISYKFNFGAGMNAVMAEPKFAYRGIRGFNNMWDAGVQLAISDQQLFFTGLYHSTENATLGVGMNFKKKYLVSGLYTTQTSDLANYSNGSFELNLKVAFGK